MKLINTAKSLVALSTLLSIFSTTALADMFQPSHSCSKPYKPYQFNSQYEVDSFNDDVRRYQQCINDFVEEQNDAVRNHAEAAEQAINDWNNFVNYELN
ncbi:hypothetical protein [Vibrio harveyi]|uniref:hypothetical protein n=1 Tax=Vibrio harveyi TaxID=669 RepID=UPI004067620C